jgi:shikimate dehydrogenase
MPTELFAVIGHPVGHSLSPAMHQAGFAARGRDAAYVACEVRPERLPEALAGLEALGFRGCNVTVPFKEAVCRLARSRSAEAAATGSANTVRFDPEGSYAATTDGAGFLAALAEELGWDPRGRRVLVLGAGGAARAIVAALLGAGASVRVTNRTGERAEALARDLGGRGAVQAVAREGDAWTQALAGADLVVNATTLGMHGRGQPLAEEELALVPREAAVVDIVYVPEETPLLAAARRRGLAAVGGLGMLVWQAALSWEVWFGERGPVDVFRAAARRALAAW